MNVKNGTREREIYIDVLRIVACLMVIFNHTRLRGFMLVFSSNVNIYPWYFLCSSLCKCAVPLFFMLSGSMLLFKEESIRQTYKRIPRIVLDLLLFSILYYLIDCYFAKSSFNIIDVLINISKTSYWHLWYLYAYIGYIITLPFLRKMVKGLDVKSSIYILSVASILMGIIPIYETFVQPLYEKLKPSWMISNIFIYPVAGYILDRIFDIKKVKPKHLIIMWISSLFCLFISGICEHHFLALHKGSTLETFLSNFSLIYASTIFITLKYIMTKVQFKYKLKAIIVEMGKCTLGIYLLHLIFLEKIPFLTKLWGKIELLRWNLGVFISCLLVFIICFVITYLLRKIPLIRKLF